MPFSSDRESMMKTRRIPNIPCLLRIGHDLCALGEDPADAEHVLQQPDPLPVRLETTNKVA